MSMSDWCNDDSCIQDVVLSDVHLYTTFTPTEEGLEGNYGMRWLMQESIIYSYSSIF
jgi:hypothetical protein